MATQDQWLILIEDKEVVVGLLTKEGKVFVGKQKNWDGQKRDDLLAAIDAGLGEALSLAGRDQVMKETVFILPRFWIDENSEVLETKKQILKEVCSSLGLSPLGFLVGDEALAQRFKDFISVYLGQNWIRLSLVRSGEVKARGQIEDGVSFRPEELVEKLAEFKDEIPFPSEMVFWGRVTPEVKEKVGNYSWEKRGFFDGRLKPKIFDWAEVLDCFAKVVLRQSSSGNDKEIQAEDRPVKLSEKEKKSGFGFVATDIADKMAEREMDAVEKEKESMGPESEEVLKKPKVKELTKKKFAKIPLNFSKIGSFVNSFSSRSKKKLFIFAPPLLLILLFIGGWYFSKLTIDLYLTPEEVEEKIDVNINLEAGELDFGEGVLSVDKKELILEGEKSKPTTGEKLIGEKAKGKVTIFNRTAEAKTFEAGTVLIGPGELKFSLDEEVRVASKTPDLVSGVDRWGESEGSITAEEFGAEYNLAANSIFSVADLSSNDVLAKNKEPLSGGTSRQIRVVSQEDKSNLKTELLDELTARVKKELKNESSQGEILEESLSLEVIDENYSADVDDEEDSLSLNLKVKAEVVELSQEKLASLAKTILEKKATEDFVLNIDSIKIKLEVNQAEDQIISGVLNLKGKAYPRVDEDEIAKKVAAKSKRKAKQLIRSYPRIYRYQIVQTPSIFKLFPLLPPKTENIKIEIKD